MSVDKDHLRNLYAKTSDPWGFRESAYEQAKFAATRAAPSQPRYRAAFELGCGNGQLARHLAPLCDRYVGMDAIEVAIDAARQAVPEAEFMQGFYPCDLPQGAFDLLILSEILYFLDEGDLQRLGRDIAGRWPRAEIICVTWLGPSGNELQGEEALSVLTSALTTHRFARVTRSEKYRIDRGLPRGPA